MRMRKMIIKYAEEDVGFLTLSPNWMKSKIVTVPRRTLTQLKIPLDSLELSEDNGERDVMESLKVSE